MCTCVHRCDIFTLNNIFLDSTMKLINYKRVEIYPWIHAIFSDLGLRFGSQHQNFETLKEVCVLLFVSLFVCFLKKCLLLQGFVLIQLVCLLLDGCSCPASLRSFPLTVINLRVP